MNMEKGLSPEEMGIKPESPEIDPETAAEVDEITTAFELIKIGQETNNPDMIADGIAKLDQAPETVLTRRQRDDERVGELKEKAARFLTAFVDMFIIPEKERTKLKDQFTGLRGDVGRWFKQLKESDRSTLWPKIREISAECYNTHGLGRVIEEFRKK